MVEEEAKVQQETPETAASLSNKGVAKVEGVGETLARIAMINASSGEGTQTEQETLEMPSSLSDQDVAQVLALVNKMNESLMQDEPLKLFLWRLNLAVMRTGLPVPRALCVKYGIDKETLRRLVKKGFLKEAILRHAETKQRMVGYTLADDVTFNEHLEVVRVMPEKA